MKNKYIYFILVFTSVFLFAQDATPYIGIYRGNFERTGEYPIEGMTEVHGIKWKFFLGERISYASGGKSSKEPWEMGNNPLIYGDMVYVVSDKLYALNKFTGKVVWEKEYEFSGYDMVVSDGALLFYGAMKVNDYFTNGILSVKAATGELNWFRVYGFDQYSSLGGGFVLYKNLLLLTTYHAQGDEIKTNRQWGYVVAIDTLTGKTAWQMEFEGGFRDVQYPALSEGKLFVYTLDRENGYDAIPAEDNARILYAIDIDKQKVLWKKKIENGIYSEDIFMGSSSKVFMADKKNNIYCIDAGNGNSIWKINNLKYSEIIFKKNNLYAYLPDKLIIINTLTGKIENEQKVIFSILGGLYPLSLDKHDVLYCMGFSSTLGPKGLYLFAYDLNKQKYIFTEYVLKILEIDNFEYLKNPKRFTIDNDKQMYFEYNGYFYAIY